MSPDCRSHIEWAWETVLGVDVRTTALGWITVTKLKAQEHFKGLSYGKFHIILVRVRGSSGYVNLQFIQS